MSNIFFNIEPKIINTELACLIGLNEAIVLQQLHYWIEKNSATGTNYIDGRVWTYGTLQEYTERDFPFWSMDTVRRTLTKLMNLGFIIKGNFNKMKMDKTSWYSIDYAALDAWIGKNASKRRKKLPPMPQMQNMNMDNDICQMQHGNLPSSSMAESNVRTLQNAIFEHGKISTSNMASCHVPSLQNATLEDGNLPSAIQETIQETKKEINNQRLDNKTYTQKPAPPTAGECVSNQNAGGEAHCGSEKISGYEKINDSVIIEPVELLFDEFWNLYPRKESKQQAKKAWIKLNPDQSLFNLIANALEYRSQTKEWLAEGGRYIPHPATWLNRRRWEDELNPAKIDQSTVLEERYGNIMFDGKPLDPVQRKQLEYIEKQIKAQCAGEVW